MDNKNSVREVLRDYAGEGEEGLKKIIKMRLGYDWKENPIAGLRGLLLSESLWDKDSNDRQTFSGQLLELSNFAHKSEFGHDISRLITWYLTYNQLAIQDFKV